MQFQRLRLTGFKSFVDPTELYIEPGLTGIVGPNGCGKSNLLEALRWVMGETKPTNMRGEGMEDVIFAGTALRPPRNLAEVTLMMDNADRTAPVTFNEHEQIEISRRIERESGSVYRLNGKEVRARDVQLLFADLATGAHSPSLVSQGRISALIAAKPKDRRAILEEAAGTSGLHSRRHEAELRLKAAQTNLERLSDIMVQIEAQLAGLKRQARQAARYKTLSGRLRAAEAMMLHLRWLHATAALAAAKEHLKEAEAVVTERTRAAAAASTAQAEASARLPPLREAAAEAAAATHRLKVEQENLDAEARRLRDAIAGFQSRLAQIAGDIGREEAQAKDAAGHLGQLAAEQAELAKEDAGHPARMDAAVKAVDRIAAETLAAESALDTLNGKSQEAAARRRGLTEQANQLSQQVARLKDRLQATEAEMARLIAGKSADNAEQEAARAVELARHKVDEARAEAEAASAARITAQAEETGARAAFDEIRGRARELQAEERGLAALTQTAQGGFTPILDQIKVKSGYEAALAAAFGEDLDLSDSSEAAAFWQTLPPVDGAAALPGGAKALAGFVTGPAALARALAQIGVVDTGDGDRLQPTLLPGQILVSRTGDAWRWDGKVSRAGAPSAAATRLEQRNRLETVRRELAEVEAEQASAQQALSALVDALDAAANRDKTAQRQVRDSEDGLIAARNAEARVARLLAEQNSRIAALQETGGRLREELGGNDDRLKDILRSIETLPPADSFAAPLQDLRRAVDAARNALSEAKAARDGLNREAGFRANRIAANGRDETSWKARAQSAAGQIAQLRARQAEAEAALAEVKDQPAGLEEKRMQLADLIAAAEDRRQTSAAVLAEAESELSRMDAALRAAEQDLSRSRELRVRAEADAEHAQERFDTVVAQITEDLDCTPGETLALAEHEEGAPLPEIENVSQHLDRLRRERDTMGPVNLRADEEAVEVQAQLDNMVRERDDLDAAIGKLRHAIAALNKEGRERLQAAFGTVNAHFEQLFTHLFGGGAAHLTLTDSDDPLDAGLEIYASPPGKRLQHLALLSGGEQALTALALIFAVFLTNPAPICILDEVDAPLDDANVERFCNLLHDISGQTGTRFLVVTHHALTMANLHRLYGVTMSERGISQLVSVDLGEAEHLVAAE
ncbi:chromosome segregation protein SMC [Emcibacter sp. SYSU 3D8]|uniref:chromosome segregation protein SMC n=1 Tax=Emcibacter sp. SYSU 3D8 TaxID=3133969 RepID=UPI0031FF1768